MSLRQIVPTWHRAYVRSHPLGLMVAVGVFLAGAVGLVLPAVTDSSAPGAILSTSGLVAFNAVWTLGGGLATVGLLRGNREIEVPGLALMAGGLTAYYIAVVTVRGVAGLAGVFMGTLALGCALRAVELYRHGYYSFGTAAK